MIERGRKHVIDFLLPYSGAHLQLWSSLAFRLFSIFSTKTFNAHDLCEKNVAGVSTEGAGMFSNGYGVMAFVNLAIER